jgi:predicted TIM-barrel fold metal-dependent hydrolase
MIARRTLLKGAAMAAVAAGTTGISMKSGGAQQVPYSSGAEPPKLKAPPNACDCHMHIYNSRFPAAPDAALRPGDAHAEDYRLFQKRIGTTRNVIVTPSTYGTDNSCTLDALATLGATARAIAVVDLSVSDAELKRLNGLGVRGMRFMLNPTSPTTVAMLEPLSKRVTDLGWHRSAPPPSKSSRSRIC